MGALRAAELAAFGMVGVGWVFEQYRDGVLEDDDEVAVVHASAEFGYRAASEAMVNIRKALAAAVAENVLPSKVADRLCAWAKAQAYPDRCWPSLLTHAKDAGIAPEQVTALRHWLAASRPNAKREDAIALLNRLAHDIETSSFPERRAFVFESTEFFEEMVHSETIQRSALGNVADATLAAYLRLHQPKATMRDALLDVLVTRETERQRVPLSPKLVEAARREVRGRPIADFSEGSYGRWAEHVAATRALSARYKRDMDVAMLEAARRAEKYERLASEVAERDRALRDRGLSVPPTLEQTGMTLDELLAWYEKRFRPVGDDLHEHALALGFSSWVEWIAEVLSQYVYETNGAAPSLRRLAT
jgi:hypothetical protein